jgi:hypothetical protein
MQRFALRTAVRSNATVISLLACSLAFGCGEADKADAEDGGADGASDGSADAGDGAADGTDGAADGTDGAADGGADGADGTDGGDGAADGGEDGGDGGDGSVPVDELVFSDDFEDNRVPEGEWVTRAGGGVDRWSLAGFADSGYDPAIGGFTFTIDGGLYVDLPEELSLGGTLPSPAGGEQCMYLQGYASHNFRSFGGAFELLDDQVAVEAERSYLLEFALGHRPGATLERVIISMGVGEERVSNDLNISELGSALFTNQSLVLDPSDALAGSPLAVRIELVHMNYAGTTTILVDNVRVTARPSAPN